MATKSIDKKKTLEYAVAFYFYDSGCVNFMMGSMLPIGSRLQNLKKLKNDTRNKI